MDYLKAHSLNTVEDLNQAIDSLNQTAAPLRRQLKQNENRMRAIAQIKDAAAVHVKLKPIHDIFIKKNFKLTKDAYSAQHKDELDAFNKAVRTLMKLNGSTDLRTARKRLPPTLSWGEAPTAEIGFLSKMAQEFERRPSIPPS